MSNTSRIDYIATFNAMSARRSEKTGSEYRLIFTHPDGSHRIEITQIGYNSPRYFLYNGAELISRYEGEISEYIKEHHLIDIDKAAAAYYNNQYYRERLLAHR